MNKEQMECTRLFNKQESKGNTYYRMKGIFPGFFDSTDCLEQSTFTPQ